MKALRIGTHLGLVLLSTTVLLPMGCAEPRPVLYPNDHSKDVGQAQADRDIVECRKMADEHASSHTGEQVATSTIIGAGAGAVSGAAGGAVTGEAGAGAAIGAAAGATAGLIRGMLGTTKPSRAYMNFVDRCLKERGYETTGWE